jgi:hypothetical protein
MDMPFGIWLRICEEFDTAVSLTQLCAKSVHVLCYADVRKKNGVLYHWSKIYDKVGCTAVPLTLL